MTKVPLLAADDPARTCYHLAAFIERAGERHQPFIRVMLDSDLQGDASLMRGSSPGWSVGRAIVRCCRSCADVHARGAKRRPESEQNGSGKRDRDREHHDAPVNSYGCEVVDTGRFEKPSAGRKRVALAYRR
jgi:hypothetical protein